MSSPAAAGRAGINRRDLLAAGAGAFAASTFGIGPARADDTLKLAIGQRGNWENAVSELGQDAGFFRKRGITLELLYTEGGGQTQQAVISGSVDLGLGVGTYGMVGAFAKNAPLRVIGAAMTGANDLYWYAPTTGPVKTMRDAAGLTVAYSTNGSSTNIVVLGLQRTLDVQFKPVATGSPASTFTQVMSGQIDVGWASPPFAVQAVDEGRIRIVARGSDVPALANQTVRVIIANAGALARKADVIARYMQSYREALDWMYSDPAALDAYGKWAGVTPALAKRVREEFFPKANLDPDRVTGFDPLMADAVTYKYLAAPLGPDQVRTLIQLQKPVA